MRQPAPLILGAGPAGCAAAIVLAHAGARPTLIDRDETPRDPLCGGFLSWRTLAQLSALGVDVDRLGGHDVRQLRLFAGGRMAQSALPHPAMGLSRHALDSAMRAAAFAAGAEFVCDTIVEIRPGMAQGKHHTWHSDTLFLASGKHDLRGCQRQRTAADPALGLRLRLPASPERTRMLAGAIELHLFRGGYAGIVLQEDGSANICLALRKSALAAAGNSRSALIAALAAASAPFAARLGEDWRGVHIDTVGAVPYGWIALSTAHGLFRLGDQAAVIPSLAGEGIGIALASGKLAAQHWLEGGAAAAPAFQRAFAAAAQPPVRWGRIIRKLIESPPGAHAALLAARFAPALVTALAERTRITGPCALPAPC